MRNKLSFPKYTSPDFNLHVFLRRGIPPADRRARRPIIPMHLEVLLTLKKTAAKHLNTGYMPYDEVAGRMRKRYAFPKKGAGKYFNNAMRKLYHRGYVEYHPDDADLVRITRKGESVIFYLADRLEAVLKPFTEVTF